MQRHWDDEETSLIRLNSRVPAEAEDAQVVDDEDVPVADGEDVPVAEAAAAPFGAALAPVAVGGAGGATRPLDPDSSGADREPGPLEAICRGV